MWLIRQGTRKSQCVSVITLIWSFQMIALSFDTTNIRIKPLCQYWNLYSKSYDFLSYPIVISITPPSHLAWTSLCHYLLRTLRMNNCPCSSDQFIKASINALNQLDFTLSLLTVLLSAAWVKLNRAGPTYLTLPTALFYPVHPILTRTMVPSNGGCCGHTHRYRGLHNQKFHTTTIGTFSFQKHNTNSSDAASRASKIGGLNKKSWPMYAHPFLSYT